MTAEQLHMSEYSEKHHLPDEALVPGLDRDGKPIIAELLLASDDYAEHFEIISERLRTSNNKQLAYLDQLLFRFNAATSTRNGGTLKEKREQKRQSGNNKKTRGLVRELATSPIMHVGLDGQRYQPITNIDGSHEQVQSSTLLFEAYDQVPAIAQLTQFIRSEQHGGALPNAQKHLLYLRIMQNLIRYDLLHDSFDSEDKKWPNGKLLLVPEKRKGQVTQHLPLRYRVNEQR